jgi:hypothetical protein
MCLIDGLVQVISCMYQLPAGNPEQEQLELIFD